MVQTALAASLAWYAASMVLGHDRPFVAAIAAVISVGAVAGQTLRRAAEWTFGVAVGLSVADVIMLALGTGPVQMGVIVALAMSTALLLRGGIMLVTEAGVSALLVANLDPTTYGLSPDRFLEALVGGGVALAVSAALPSNPSLRVREAARPILDDLAIVYRESAEALSGPDPDLAAKTLDEARRIDLLVVSLREELDGGFQIARYCPPRRRHLNSLSYYAAAAEQLDLAVRNTRVLARAVVGAIQEEKDVPVALSGAMRNLARAVETLSDFLEKPEHPTDTRHFALEAAKEATAALEQSHDLETALLIGQVRSTSFDFLRASGLGIEEALEIFREATISRGVMNGTS